MQTNIHIGVPILGSMLLFLFAGIGIYHYPLHKQHTPTHSNATHEDILYEAHKTRITALQDELMQIKEDANQFNTIADSPFLPPDLIQRFQTAGKHIEELQKATACEGAGPWKVEAYELAVQQERQMSLCEWLGGSAALTDTILTYEALIVCWLETGDRVMTADSKIIRRAQASNDIFVGNKQPPPLGDKQALYHMWLSYCQEVLELREEFMRDSGDLGEGKFLSGSVVGRWRVR